MSKRGGSISGDSTIAKTAVENLQEKVLTTPVRDETIEGTNVSVEDVVADPRPRGIMSAVSRDIDPDTTVDDTTVVRDQFIDAALQTEQERYAQENQQAPLVVTEEQRKAGVVPRGQQTTPAMLTPEERAAGVDPDRVDRWDFNNNITTRSSEQRAKSLQAAREANEQVGSDGGLTSRVMNLADQVEQRNVGLGGLTRNAKDNMVLNSLDTIGALETDPDTGNRTANKEFLMMLALVAEDSFATLSMQDGVDAYELMKTGEYEKWFSGETVGPETGIFQSRKKDGTPTTKVVPVSQGRAQLGRRIFNEWQRMQGIDEPGKFNNEDAEVLGDIAKELYFAANESDANPIIELVHIPNPEGSKRPIRGFRITPYGETMLSAGLWKRALAFPADKIRPSKDPLEQGRLVGDAARVARNISGAKGAVVGAGQINQAKNNLSSIPNQVLPQRLKILFATVLPVLMNSSNPLAVAQNDPLGFALINHVGLDTLDSIRAQVKRKKNLTEFQKNREVQRIYGELLNKLAQDVFGVSLERHGANFFTYYTQAFSGRISDPQQNTLNPTRSKTARFVTANAVPARVGNKDVRSRRYEKALRQMYAMSLIDKRLLDRSYGADTLTPEGRDAALDQHTDTLYKWGNTLRDAMNGISDADVQAVADAIEKGIPLTVNGQPNPEFPQLPRWEDKIQGDTELVEAIKRKGEDGQVFIDGLIDFANYQDKKNNPNPDGTYEHSSFFNAMMDGKTNGLASNGMQMGDAEMAFRTGVIRQRGSDTFLDGNIDIRDQLAKNLIRNIEKGFNGSDQWSPEEVTAMYDISKIVFNSRDLNKKTTMTFPYGRELESFKRDIGDSFNVLLEESKRGENELVASVDSIKAKGWTDEKIIETLHAKYVDGLIETLSPEVIASRNIMRSVAQLAGISNELFTIVSPTGFELNLGDAATTGIDESRSQQITIFSPKDKSQRPTEKLDYKKGEVVKTEPKVPIFGKEYTAAAEKTYKNWDEELGMEVETVVPGDVAYGGSVPAPIHSIDAATVVRTVTGKSWNKLVVNSGGHPYVHTVYDAFKVDAMSYDTILEEANNNWFEINLGTGKRGRDGEFTYNGWSYLEAARDALDKLDKDFKDRWKDYDDSYILDKDNHRNDVSVMEYLLEYHPRNRIINAKELKTNPLAKPVWSYGYPHLAKKLTKILPPGTDIDPYLRGILDNVKLPENYSSEQTLGDMELAIPGEDQPVKLSFKSSKEMKQRADGTTVSAHYNRDANTISLDRETIMGPQYAEQAWRKPKVPGVVPIDRDFTKEEWFNFVLTHEYMHSKYPRGMEPFKGKLNIWYGSGENSGLSNLALRPFKDKEGRVYQTVEHAYQTLKSGKFDEEVYNKPWKEGSKFVGKRPVNKEISIGLMTKLIQASLDQNPDAMSALQETRGKEITHNEDRGVWNKEFPRILMQIRDGSSSSNIDESKADYENRINNMALEAIDSGEVGFLEGYGQEYSRSEDSITLGDLKQFRKVMEKELGVRKRLNNMIYQTNKKRKELKEFILKEIRAGRPVWQYYSH